MLPHETRQMRRDVQTRKRRRRGNAQCAAGFGVELRDKRLGLLNILQYSDNSLVKAFSRLGELELPCRPLEKARAECDLLNELNVFYLELLKTEAEAEEIGYDRVDIEELIREIVDQFPDDYDAHERVQVTVDNNAHFIRINPSTLKLIVMNLVENALLYAQVKTPIRVEVERTRNKRGNQGGHLLHIRVVDEGVGIPESFLKRIFSPFVRLREDMADGAGLGLTLVRSLVELNGGDVFIRSEVDKGTVVNVTLPAADEQGDKPVILL